MPDSFRTEEFKVEGEKLIAKIRELIHEGVEEAGGITSNRTP